MTLAFVSARRSIIFAWISRDHGQRPILSMLRLSIAITEILSDGVRAEARTPQSYAKRSRASINWVPPAASITSETARQRNQSFFQKPALVIASPVCSYCCSTRDALRVLAFYANHLSPMKSSKLLNKQCPRGHFYSEKWRQSNFPSAAKAAKENATIRRASRAGRCAEASQLPSTAPGARLFWATSSAADTFLPSSCFALRTSIRPPDRKRLNSSHVEISYAVFCLKKKKN